MDADELRNKFDEEYASVEADCCEDCDCECDECDCEEEALIHKEPNGHSL